MRTPVDVVVVKNSAEILACLRAAVSDICDAGGAETIDLVEGTPSVSVTLAPEEPAST